MKVKLKFLFPFLLKIKAFREASFTCSVSISKQKTLEESRIFHQKSCFPHFDQKSRNALSSLQKAWLNYQKNSTATIITTSRPKSLQTKLSLNTHKIALFLRIISHHFSFLLHGIKNWKQWKNTPLPVICFKRLLHLWDAAHKLNRTCGPAVRGPLKQSWLLRRHLFYSKKKVCQE